MSTFAVVDVETTGFGKLDRVVEIGVVVVDAVSGEIVDEFDTLVNPERDLGATHIHGVSASMVESAPTFGEVSGVLARVLGTKTLTAHNLPFDQRFLRQEFERANIDVDLGVGVCTLKLSGERLDMACSRYGIALPEHHRALADARATAQLLLALEAEDSGQPVRFRTDVPVGFPRTLRRDAVGGKSMPLAPSRFQVRYPTVDEMTASYLNVLDAYLADLVLDAQERDSLQDLADLYGFSGAQRHELHEAYVAALVAAARRDGMVSAAEHDLVRTICAALGTDASLVPAITPNIDASIASGQRVCFTGSFIIDGTPTTKEDLARLAATAGLQPVGDVTKAGCDLLVASDPASASGKAKKARGWGIPVIGIAEFLNQVRTSA